MSKIKIAELFYSIQGEGRHMGVPSVFLRTFGCNLKCAGFGMPKGKLSEERIKIAESSQNYKDYKSLPLVSTGCDSYASWDPNFKHLSPYYDTGDVVSRIMDILPFNAWHDERETDIIRVILTRHAHGIARPHCLVEPQVAESKGGFGLKP